MLSSLSFPPPTLLTTITTLLIPHSLSLAAYLLHHHFTTTRKHARLARSHGCKPLRRWKTWDPFFSLDFLYVEFTWIKAHKMLEMMEGQFRKTGCRTAVLRLLWGDFIVCMESENLKAVLATDFKSWELPHERKKYMGEFLGQGIFTTDGEEWKHSRDMLRPSFARSRISDGANFEKHCQRLIGCVPRNGEMVDLKPLFFAFSMDVATEFLFGESSDMLARWGTRTGKTVDVAEKKDSVSVEEFVEAFTYAQVSLEVGGEEDEGLIGFVKLFLPNRKMKRAFKTVNRYVEGIVEKGLAKHADYKLDKSNYCFLHEIISETTDKIKIRAELLNILLAGRETTASLLSNVWFEVSKRPDIWARLQREVATLDGNLPTFEQLKELKYLNAVLKESLRLYPVVPMNSRQAAEDTVLPLGGGDDEKSPVFVPKGCYFHWNLWAMHRRKDLFGDDAEEFKPERWLDEDGKKGLRVGWEYLPFHGGPRICIGQQFALTEACYVTVRLMQEFEGIESRDPEPWIEQLGLTVSGKNGAKVVLKAQSRS